MLHILQESNISKIWYWEYGSFKKELASVTEEPLIKSAEPTMSLATSSYISFTFSLMSLDSIQ